MSLSNYSVFRGKVDRFHAERDDDESPHFQLFVRGDNRTIRSAINVKSKFHPSQLAFHINRNFQHPLTADIQTVSDGFTSLPRSQRRGLDYIRSNLFELNDVVALPPNAPGVSDDLQDLVFSLCRSAQEADADVFVLGEPFPNGIHDVHMNQGNFGSFSRDNGIFQDGGVLFHFASENRWSALFLAFQSQAIHTDDNGDPIPGSPRFAEVIADGDVTPIEDPVDPTLVEEEGAIRILGALVNPEGAENQPSHDGRRESVTLFNYSPDRKPLDGWRLKTKGGERLLDQLGVDPGAVLRIDLGGTPPLGNKGGTISLLDANNKKIHGVSYTKEQARREGWTLKF